MKKVYKKPRYGRVHKPGSGNYPFYVKSGDSFYTKPGYEIRASKKNPRKLRKAKREDNGLPF